MNDNKVLLRDIETGKVSDFYPVDAKECLVTGRYEVVSSDVELVKPDWLEAPKPTFDAKETKAVEDDIANLNSKQIIERAKEEGLEIEGLSEMTLVNKRKALSEAILAKNASEESKDDSEEHKGEDF
jgi:hypothetical protein